MESSERRREVKDEAEVTKDDDVSNPLQFEYSAIKEPASLLKTVTPANREQTDMLPEVEDVHEPEERTMIVNKIRISRIKGSHASLLSTHHEPLNKESMAAVTPFYAPSRLTDKIGSPVKSLSSPKEGQRAKPQCTFSKVPQSKNSHIRATSTGTKNLIQRNNSSRDFLNSVKRTEANGITIEIY